jgi:hypothetical protein
MSRPILVAELLLKVNSQSLLLDYYFRSTLIHAYLISPKLEQLEEWHAL